MAVRRSRQLGSTQLTRVVLLAALSAVGICFAQAVDLSSYPDYTQPDHQQQGVVSVEPGSRPLGSTLAGKGVEQRPSLEQLSSSKGTDGSSSGGGHVPVFTILSMTIFMSAMAGLGAVPFFFCGQLKQSWAGIANAVACGVMLAASFDLLHEGAPYSPMLTILGMVLGALFIKASQEYLSQYEDASFEDLSGADARKAMLIVGVMAAHAFGEGSGVGVSFSGHRGWAQGTLVTIAIGLHNIPEGMAVATVMVAKGAPPRKALFWSLFCAFPQALVALPSYLFVETFQALLPLALGFAAGCMVWIVCAELMPDALESAPHPQVATAATLSAAWLQGLSMLIATLEQPNGVLASPIQADLGYVLRQLLGVLPALAVPCIATTLGASAVVSEPVSLGITSAAAALLGAGHLVGVILSGGGPLGLMMTIVWACGGALVALLAMKNIVGPGSSSQGQEVKRSLESQLEEALETNGAARDLVDSSQAWIHSHSNGHLRQGVLTDRGQHMTVSVGLGAAERAATWQIHGMHGQAVDGANGKAGMEAPCVLPSSALLSGMHPSQSMPGQLPFQQGSWEPNGKAAYSNGSHTNGTSYSHEGVHDPATCECQACRQQGHSMALQAASLAGHQTGGLNGWAGGSQQNNAVQAVFPEFSSRHNTMQRTAVGGVLLLSAYSGTNLGGSLARALAAGSSPLHVLVPLALQGLPLGLACIGLSRALGMRGSLPLAGAMSALCFLVALTCLSVSPVHVQLPEAMAGWTYDALHHTQAAQAAVAGALILGSVKYLWPAAVSKKARRARAGFTLGAAVTAGVCLLSGALCKFSPYCM